MKAERWLTESFARGVEEFRHQEVAAALEAGKRPPPQCFFSRFDPARRPCEGKLERAHFIGRQRVENAMYALLPDPAFGTVTMLHPSQTRDEVAAELGSVEAWRRWRDDLILLAAWSPKNGGLACEGHHRRFDDHQVSIPAERIVVPRTALPQHVVEFADEYGLETQLEERFPG